MHRITNQRSDGSFDHFITFGTSAPWNAGDEDTIHCATEEDAIKLQRKIEEGQARKLSARPA